MGEIQKSLLGGFFKIEENNLYIVEKSAYNKAWARRTPIPVPLSYAAFLGGNGKEKIKLICLQGKCL